MNPKWNPRELFGIDLQANSPFTCIGIAKSKPRHPRCRNPIGREKRAQASKLLDNISKLAISGDDYRERDVKKNIQEVQKEVLCWRHREGGTHPQCKEMEREWWEKLRNAQAQHNEHVPPPQLRPEYPGLFRRYQDGGLVRAVVPQHMNGNPNPDEIANRVRMLEQEEAEIRDAEQSLQLRLFALARRREDTVRERAALAREVEEVARRVEEERRAQAAQAARLAEENRRREEAARRAEEDQRAQIAARLVEAERQRHEVARRVEDERRVQAEQRRRYEGVIRQQRERAQRALDEQMRIDQALAQQLDEEERRQEAERQEARRREQGIRRIQNRIARMQRFALQAPPPQQPQPQRNPEIAAPPVQIPVQRAAEPHIVRRKPLEECFACLEPIRAPQDAEWCRAQCGQNICNGCFELWHANQPIGVLLRCGICRAIWKWEVHRGD